MENATKALLIAAGVLIVILLIAFGMSIFNSTGDTSGQVADASSSQQMQTFNAQFQSYIGSNKSGTMIRNLLVAVNNSNKRSTQHDVTIVCTITNTAGDVAIVNAAAGLTGVTETTQVLETGSYSAGAALDVGATYTVTPSYGANGYLYALTIK